MQLRKHPIFSEANHAWLLVAALVAAPLASAAPAAPASPPLPSLDSGELGQGQFSLMHTMLQKTFLKINVATIDVRVDRPTQNRFAALAGGKPYSDALAQQLAPVAMAAGRAVVQMQFKHDVSLARWMGVVRDYVDQARDAGLVTRDLAQRVNQALPQWFASLRERGYQKGDRLIYALSPGALRTVVVSVGGQVLLDRIENEQGARGVVLTTYFAPGGDLREPLLRSMFQTR
jgi:hypothetical protein